MHRHIAQVARAGVVLISALTAVATGSTVVSATPLAPLAPLALLAAGSGAGRVAGGPAGGDPATTVTFTVTSGALAMTAPATANLGSGAPGTTISGPLGNVLVTDDRALLSAAWTATASSTAFTTGSATTPETIPASDVTYTPGTVSTTGTITATPSGITLSGSAQTVVSGTAGVGNNTASWNPVLAVTVPAAAVGGAYTATLTQSVS